MLARPEKKEIKMRQIVEVIATFLLFVQVFAGPCWATETQEESGKKLTSVFKQSWLKSVISVEQVQEDPKEEHAKYAPIGTGFLIASPNKHIVLITAKHVIIDKKTQKTRENLAYRLNDKKGHSIIVTEEGLRKGAVGSWYLSSDRDVACRFMFVPTTSDLLQIPLSSFLEAKYVQPGAPVLLLGFPLGLRSENYAKPIVRQGIVALSEPNDLVVDVDFYPGNSGGAVVYVPPIKMGKGLSSPLINEEKLVGLAINFIPYVDVAVSAHTGRPRATFEENSGLCNVVPADAILSLLKRRDVSAVDEELTEKLKVEHPK